MFLKKEKSAALTEEIRQLTQEYEKVTKEQKERILSLREQNRELSAQLEIFLQEKGAIANTLVQAEHTGQQLIAQAKQRCDQLLGEAYRKEAASHKRLEEHRTMLRELAQRCEHILNSIETELHQPPAVLSIELPAKKHA